MLRVSSTSSHLRHNHHLEFFLMKQLEWFHLIRRIDVEKIRREFEDIERKRGPTSKKKKPICRAGGSYAHSCDMLNLGFLNDMTAKYQLNASTFWERSILDIEESFVAIRKEFDALRWGCPGRPSFFSRIRSGTRACCWAEVMADNVADVRKAIHVECRTGESASLSKSVMIA